MYIRQRVSGVLNATFYYLGTAVTSPETEITVAWIPVMNDLGGRSVSIQDVYDGEVHKVSFTLNRFNWQTYNRLRTGTAGPTISAGGDAPTDRGRVHRGVDDYQFLLTNSYVGSIADNGDMPAGRLYYYAKPLAFREGRVGTRVEEVTCLIECTAGFNATTRGFEMFTEAAANWGSVTPE
jgi:hypothetical protein